MDLVKELVIEAMEEPSTGDDWLDARYAEDIPIVGHTNPYYKFFWLAAYEFEPSFSVELGTYRGVTAGHLGVGNPEGTVYTIDWHRDAADKRHQVCAIAMAEHYQNVHYLNGCSWDDAIVESVADYAAVHPIDILFIDAWHWYEHAIREWNIYSPMLADEALVVCDDIVDAIGSTVDMEKFWAEVSDGYESFTNNAGLHVAVPMGFFKFVRR
jgi:predicted O-methyltransferase YrrM